MVHVRTYAPIKITGKKTIMLSLLWITYLKILTWILYSCTFYLNDFVRVLEIGTINLNDFSLFVGTIILMPIILMGAYHCTVTLTRTPKP